jgi:2-methylisocitrate lyase-like PEP mutase family enzyme
VSSAIRERLRALIAADAILAAPGAHDPLTARLGRAAGLSAVYLGGNAMALGLGKGQPFLTLTETASAVAAVSRAIDLPVIADAGAGFGEAAHIHLAVREIEAAGAAALHLDDQPYPKSADYHRGRGRLAEVGDMVARLRTALSARRDPATMILARTDALRVTGSLDETIVRASAYAETGIDGLIILDLDPGRAAAVRAALPSLPLLWIGGVRPPLPSLAQLEGAGFAAALYPFSGVAEVAVRLLDLWRGLAEEGCLHQSDALLNRARPVTLELADMPALWALSDGGDR